MSRKPSRELLELSNRELALEASCLRILTSCLLNGTAPYSADEVETQDEEYIEKWSHYRPDSACGGVVLIEQFERATQARVSWQTVVGMEVANRYQNSDVYRREASNKCHRNQFTCVGVS